MEVYWSITTRPSCTASCKNKGLWHYHRGRQWHPLQCSCLENPRDGGACWAAVCGVAQSQTRLKWLSSSSSRHHQRNPTSTQKFAVVSTSLSFSVNEAWTLTAATWLFGTLVHHLLGLLTFQVKPLSLAPTSYPSIYCPVMQQAGPARTQEHIPQPKGAEQILFGNYHARLFSLY